MFFSNPLEQFRIIELTNFTLFSYNIDITNTAIIIFLVSFFLFFFYNLIFINNKFSIQLFS